MSKTIHVAKYEFLKIFRRKAFLLAAIVLPMLAIAVLAVVMPFIPGVFQGIFGDKGTGYVDLADFVEPTENMQEFTDIDSARYALLEENISSFFVIEEGYPHTNNITVYIKGNQELNPIPWNDIKYFLLNRYLEYAEVDNETSERIIYTFQADVINLDESGEETTDTGVAGFLIPYVFAFLLIVGIMVSSSYLMQGIGEEKENRTGEILLSSISSDQLLRGKMLGYGALGMFQTAMWALAAITIILISPLSTLFAVMDISWMLIVGVVYLVMGYALFAASMATTASISSSAKEAQQTSSIFTIMAIIPIVLLQFIIREPNSIISEVLTYFPFTSPFTMLVRMSITTVPIYAIMISLIILAVSIFIMSKLAGKVFRMGMLKYDKRASLKEILGFLKEK